MPGLPPDDRWRKTKGVQNGGGHRPRTLFLGVAEELRTRPNRWALVKRYPGDKGPLARQHVHHIRAGKRYDFTPHDYEAELRRIDNVIRLYIRYVGEGLQ